MNARAQCDERHCHGLGLLLAIVSALVISLASVPSAWADSAFAGGTGTADDPYLIQTVDQLQAFRDAVNKGNAYEGDVIRLDADLDISPDEWVPIGKALRNGSGIVGTSTPFKGAFDGAGHTIAGLTITKTSNAKNALGLFGALDGATVRDLKLTDVRIDVANSDGAGALAGLAIDDATIEGIQVSGSVRGDAGIGGVIGRMTLAGTISGCSNRASVSATGTGNAGGIVGAAYYTDTTGQMVITGCTNAGAISGTQAIGGIAGLNSAFVSDCSNTGAVTGSDYSVGGIVGEQKNYGAVSRCSNGAAIESASPSGYGTGGIVGWVRYDGAASAYQASAPIAIVDNTNTGAVKGGNDAGGIVGTLYDAGVVTGNESTAPSLEATMFAGGIVGNLQASGSAALPSTLVKGARVENNVSTTSLADISAANKDAFAYDNDPSLFAVTDNGTAWVAEANGVRFATVARAVEMAGNGGTATLIADVADAGTITEASDGTTMLDLDGHTLVFAESPAIRLSSGTLRLVGAGNVITAGKKLADLVVDEPASGASTALALAGGTYVQDVEAYVADGYAELVHHDAVDGARYQVLPADEAKADATAAVTTDGRTEYFENADDAKLAALLQPGSTLTLFDQTSDTPGTVPPTQQPTNPIQAANPKTPTPIPVSATGGDLARTGDEAWPLVLFDLAAILLASMVMGFALRRVRGQAAAARRGEKG